jgi:hypothetical protein
MATPHQAPCWCATENHQHPSLFSFIFLPLSMSHLISLSPSLSLSLLPQNYPFAITLPPLLMISLSPALNSLSSQSFRRSLPFPPLASPVFPFRHHFPSSLSWFRPPSPGSLSLCLTEPAMAVLSNPKLSKPLTVLAHLPLFAALYTRRSSLLKERLAPFFLSSGSLRCSCDEIRY